MTSEYPQSKLRPRTRPPSRQQSGRTIEWWFGLAGLAALLGWGLFVSIEPAYYDATSAVDYVGVVSLTGVLVVAGLALILLWRDPPVARGSLFLLFAGVGAVVEGLGNLLEDAFDMEVAVWAFFGGGLVMMVSLLIAGIAALTVNSPLRWSGLFLLFAVPGGMLGFGIVMMGVAWILLALWIVHQHRVIVVAQATAAVPALATAIHLHL